MATLRESDNVYPDAYSIETRHGMTAKVYTEESRALCRALLDGEGLEPLGLGGRAEVSAFPLDDGEGILREYRRGGWVARWLHDGFLRNRMVKEFEIVTPYYHEGGPVPQPLGVRWTRSGLFVRGAIATRRVAGITLLDYLRQEKDGGVDRVLRAAGEAIRHMHDYGILHADLQLKNILASPEEIWLIDFDRARKGRQVGRVSRSRNLLRLRRSFEKHGIALDNFATLLDGYGPISWPRWLAWAYCLRSLSAPFRGAQ